MLAPDVANAGDLLNGIPSFVTIETQLPAGPPGEKFTKPILQAKLARTRSEPDDSALMALTKIANATPVRAILTAATGV